MLRNMVRFLSSIFVIATLFLISSHTFNSKASSDVNASVRWAQVDKGVASYAYRAGAMMIQKDKITSISQTYGALMFDGTRWNSATDPMTFPRSDISGNMFLDSRGIVYVGGVRADYNGTNTPYSYIYESTDGLHFTPVQAFIDLTGGGYIWNFTEDKYGNVWAGEFTGGTTSTGAHLWRRRPNGVWTNVANWALPEIHIHNVYYDPYRDALYVAIGDRDHGILKLQSNKINAEGISSDDFTFILPSLSNGTPVEVTAITSDANYIYAGMDMHMPYGPEARGIARITDDNVSQSIEIVYPLAECAVWEWADVDDAGNIIFSSIGINEWSCSNNYVNQILASSDQGTTWTVVKDFGSSSTSRGLAHTGMASHYASNWSGLYGGGNGWGGQSLRATIGRLIPTNTTFYVDGTNGVDWTTFGNSELRPVKTLNYLEMLDIQPGDTVRFLGSSTYLDPLIAGWSGNSLSKISLRGNTTSIFAGGNVANAPAVIETFELSKAAWRFALDESGGSITADTSIVHSGIQSAKIVRGDTGTVSLRLDDVALTNITPGDTMYLSYWVYYPTDQTSNSDPNMLRIIDSSDYELRLLLNPPGTSSLPNEPTLRVSVLSTYQIPARRSLSSGTWHKIYIEDYLHATDGRFKMYVDDVLWFNINGIKTITADRKLLLIYFFNYEKPITYYIDDFKFGKMPFDERGAINTNNYSYLNIGGFRIQGKNGVVISSETSDVDLHDSILNGLIEDAIINKGNANINLYYNTVFGSGRYGINAIGNATLINNVVYQSVTNDVFIASGKTLTGSNNWFKDSGKGGPGTYTDTGNTTWSGSDPVFRNSGSGDFHLSASSPLINAGTTIAGFTSDFEGTTRPQGAAPEIGAYEFNVYKVHLPIIIK